METAEQSARRRAREARELAEAWQWLVERLRAQEIELRVSE